MPEWFETVLAGIVVGVLLLPFAAPLVEWAMRRLR